MIRYLMIAIAVLWFATPAAAQTAATDANADWWLMPTPGQPITDRLMLIDGQFKRTGNIAEIGSTMMFRAPDHNNVIAVRTVMLLDCSARTYTNRLLQLDKADGTVEAMNYLGDVTPIGTDHSVYRFACLNDAGGLKHYGRGGRNGIAQRIFAEPPAQ
ncbi:hypothetical protein P1X14_12130 [Sphingomonas sp. AOB5]|uniref:hypothetical protein n=1 Tax=Sphingomonas sp. AOB5 TaxID=3034017 RepID=UPI0023F8C2FE|nr:hypothetical protein [Sphingomonas sp. AOB5]MDF7775997.1 hypothetical protein [Sphingomonas sp. AOB5]